MICRASSDRPSRARRWQFTTGIDQLEKRELLTTTAGLVANPLYRVISASSSGPPSSAYTPAEIAGAYGFNQIAFGKVQGNGAGETIAIVDAYSDPNIQSDLNTFDTAFGLTSTTVTQVNENGGTSLPGADRTGGWELEESLDVEWAHAIAPGAKIILVAASSANDSDLLAGIDYAAAHANVVSMSWGGSEFSQETSASYENNFIHSGVVFTVASGDTGAPVDWPSSSPDVVAVGGTSLSIGAGETGWSGSTGGPSEYETKPSFQSSVVTQTSMRANPDVSYNADPNMGFAVYDSYRGGGGWIQVGGTSAGAPQWAALFAIADQGRALAGQSPLNTSSPEQAQALLYQNAGTAAFHDILSGTSDGSPAYSAGPGYDYVTGIGTPAANLLVTDLGGNVTPPVTPDHLVVTSAGSTTAGSPLTVTVTAQMASGTTDTAYTGTIAFTSSDAQAGLPANYTFVAGNHGVATFSVTLKTAGSQSIVATDVATAATTGTDSSISVSPAAASQFILAGLSTSATAGVSQSFTLTARDAYGNLATKYVGTVSFTSTDGSASLPSSYTFTSANQGVASFSVTFNTAGTQSLTVTGTNPTLSVTQSGIAVSPATPLSLTATPFSTSQIKLAWTAAAGATGYSIQQSLNGSTGWTAVGTTTGVTTYQVTGLSAGTTYYYRVAATGGSATTSGYSSIAYATTTGSSTGGGGGGVTSGTTDTIWSNSYTPFQNAYSYGSYDVGVKFESSVAGSVTGVRFYKETWMNGWTHVGYLWSSTGRLLATATFTNETSSGWQQMSFSSPVAITANSVYIVSFSTGGGYFGVTTGYFNGASVSSPPLTALANGISGSDGVYGVGNGSFPSTAGNGMNFWADVAFSPTASSSSATTHAAVATSTPGVTGLIAPAGPAAAFASSSSANTSQSGLGNLFTTRQAPKPNFVNSTGNEGRRSLFGSW